MRVIRKIADAIKNIKRKQQQKKYNFVFNLGYRYFLDCDFEDLKRHLGQKDELDIPDFLNDFKRKSLAHYLTCMQMKKIMDCNALNRCYKKAKEFAKQHKVLAQGL